METTTIQTSSINDAILENWCSNGVYPKTVFDRLREICKTLPYQMDEYSTTLLEDELRGFIVENNNLLLEAARLGYSVENLPSDYVDARVGLESFVGLEADDASYALWMRMGELDPLTLTPSINGAPSMRLRKAAEVGVEKAVALGYSTTSAKKAIGSYLKKAWHRTASQREAQYEAKQAALHHSWLLADDNPYTTEHFPCAGNIVFLIDPKTRRQSSKDVSDLVRKVGDPIISAMRPGYSHRRQEAAKVWDRAFPRHLHQIVVDGVEVIDEGHSLVTRSFEDPDLSDQIAKQILGPQGRYAGYTPKSQRAYTLRESAPPLRKTKPSGGKHYSRKRVCKEY